MDNQEILSLDGSAIPWSRFKEVFLKQYYPKVVRLRKQQEFTNLTQGVRSVDDYAREFMRLKQFAPSLVDIKLKMVERFVIGLNSEISRMVEVIDPTMYEANLRVAKAMEKPKEEVGRE